MNCYICNKLPDGTKLLRCGCYCCSKCYCIIKDEAINICLECGKKLIRGSKKNKK